MEVCAGDKVLDSSCVPTLSTVQQPPIEAPLGRWSEESSTHMNHQEPDITARCAVAEGGDSAAMLPRTAHRHFKIPRNVAFKPSIQSNLQATCGLRPTAMMADTHNFTKTGHRVLAEAVRL